MISEGKFTYEVHGRNKDTFGDPILGVSRMKGIDKGLVIPIPIIAFELTDRPTPKIVENLIIPSNDEIGLLTGTTRKSSGNQNFIEYFGLGEEKALEEIVQDVAVFAAYAIREARSLKMMQLTDLLDEEESAFMSVQAKAHELVHPEGTDDATATGYGMYL